MPKNGARTDLDHGLGNIVDIPPEPHSGAAAKQHGFHLPLNTDRIQAERFAAKLAERIDALIWPVLVWVWRKLKGEAPAAASERSS